MDALAILLFQRPAVLEHRHSRGNGAKHRTMEVPSFEELQQRLDRLSIAEANDYFRKNLSEKGTQVELNDQDPFGDGDQSLVKASDAQFYRHMFAIGGDIHKIFDLNMEPLSLFAKNCLVGVVEYVRETLERVAGKSQDKTQEPSSELIELLERREAAMRFTPLLMLVSMGKNIGLSTDKRLRNRQIEVAKLLLQYGARPDAKDICGKTVCHYGMGAMATSMTLEVADMCVKAHQTSRWFGQMVELHSLKSASRNGKQGICKGYMVDTGRRVVYLLDEGTTVCVKPENLRLVDDPAASQHTPVVKLFNVPDRLGAVCLLEVIQSNRTDVANILLDDNQADLDVTDCDGCSPRSLSLHTAIFSKVAAMVNRAAGKATKKQDEEAFHKCANCNKQAPRGVSFKVCSRCKKVVYCGRECQEEHWKSHRKECKKEVRAQELSVRLDRPQGSLYYSSFSLQGKRRGQPGRTEQGDTGYRKPSGVGFGEKFIIKVQGDGPSMPLMVYDKTRECNFSVSPSSTGFSELREAVNAEPTWQGHKTFVPAMFDEDGTCTVFPGQRSIHKW